MANPSIDDKIKSLLSMKPNDTDTQEFEKIKDSYQKFAKAPAYQSAQKALDDLVTQIKQFHYQDMRPSTSSDDEKKKQELALFESFLIAEMEERFRMMSNFFKEQQTIEAEQLYEEKILDKKAMEDLVKLSYELARAVEEHKKTAEYEKLMYHADKQPLFSLSKEEIHEAIYSKLRKKVTETVEDIFKRFGVDRPLTEEEGALYKQAQNLYQEYEKEKDLQKANYLVDQFMNLCKIYNYSHYDEYGQQDKKDPSFFAQMGDELKATKREELALTAGFDFFKTIGKIAEGLNDFIQNLTNKDEEVEQSKSSQFRPEPPKGQ